MANKLLQQNKNIKYPNITIPFSFSASLCCEYFIVDVGFSARIKSFPYQLMCFFLQSSYQSILLCYRMFHCVFYDCCMIYYS